MRSASVVGLRRWFAIAVDPARGSLAGRSQRGLVALNCRCAAPALSAFGA